MKHLEFIHPQVMGILNLTPDSFFSESRASSIAAITRRVEQIAQQGASIVDLGGYSSRPGAMDVSLDEEWNRTKRGLAIVKSVAPDLIISVDTFRAEIARRAVESFGEIIINDISAGEREPSIIEVAAKYSLPYVAMHMRGCPETMATLTQYNDVTKEVCSYLENKIYQLERAGLKQIIIDPGFGFAKSIEQNYSLLKRLNEICALGYPTLSGVSRKSMIYKTLDSTPEDALAGTIALGWESLRQGAKILRVHDVREAVDTIKIFETYDKSE